MRRMLCSTSLFALAAAAVLSAAPAAAQATGDTDTPAADARRRHGKASATSSSPRTRRSENLQDIPLSVATVSDETLAAINAGGADIRGLSGRVPSLNIESSFGRTFPRFYIRGLGNTDFDLNASQPVSLVYDDVVLENPILKGFPAFDVDRIEVLRGPQGTLFGRNTPAGIVKFDTVKPGQRPQLRADQLRQLSARSTPRARSAASSSDDVAVRLSGLWQHRNDWIDNLDEPGKHDLEGYDDIALRGAGPVQADRRADDPPDRPAARPRRRRAHLPRQCIRDAAATIWSALDGGDFKRDEVRDRRAQLPEAEDPERRRHDRI